MTPETVNVYAAEAEYQREQFVRMAECAIKNEARLRAFENAAREATDHFACEDCNCAGLKPSMDKLRALLVEQGAVLRPELPGRDGHPHLMPSEIAVEIRKKFGIAEGDVWKSKK